MRSTLIAMAVALAATTSAFAGGGEKVTLKVNGREAKGLSEGLYIKPGSYKKPPTEEFKRAELQTLEVTAPTANLDAGDSLKVELIGYVGAQAYYRQKQTVAPGGSANFELAGPATQDFTPNGKNPTNLGRFEVEVTPLKRSNQKGMYKGAISLK